MRRKPPETRQNKKSRKGSKQRALKTEEVSGQAVRLPRRPVPRNRLRDRRENVQYRISDYKIVPLHLHLASACLEKWISLSRDLRVSYIDELRGRRR